MTTKEIIEDAAKEIILNFSIWEEESHIQCQIDQSGEFYDTHMMECVTDVLTRMLEEERYICQSKECRE